VRLGGRRVGSHKRDRGSSERDAAEKRRLGGVVRDVYSTPLYILTVRYRIILVPMIDPQKARFGLIEWTSSTTSLLDLTAEKLPCSPNLRK
jgi:hypothetical protein